MTRNSRGPLARSSLSPSFPSTESIDGAVSSSERSASSGRVLHLEVKLFRDSRLVNHHAARQAESLGKLGHGPPGRSVSIRREVLLPLGWPHQGFSLGGNEGCERSLGVQLPPLVGWSLRPLLATVSEHIGTSLVSRWNFSRNRSSRSVRSMARSSSPC